jgi:hypothetical protein
MRFLTFRNLLLAGAVMAGIVSCKKDPDPGTNNQKPKVGTTWTYIYYTYYNNGGLATSGIVTHKAVSEEMLGGEAWLKIKDVAADTVVYWLKEKTGGLYQYTNNSSYILCKSPATLNDTYTTFNKGSAEDFVVKDVNLTLPTNIGDVVVNYYEGSKNGELLDQIWYNSNAWIVRHQVYRKPPLGVNYKYSALFIQSITY